jgi:hypothetical protein
MKPNLSLPGAFKWISAICVVVLLLLVLLGEYWSQTPAMFEPVSPNPSQPVVVGYVTTATLAKMVNTLLDKPGGYLSNDMLPPGAWLDNMPNWEFGVLVQVRDLARVLRKDISRSQSQSEEDEDLVIAEPQFNFDNASWWLPASETEYRTGLKALRQYIKRLQGEQKPPAQFYARADNLRNWLGDAQTRLGSLSQRLAASVNRPAFVPMDIQTPMLYGAAEMQTPWLQLDDVFYEARGSAWALSILLKAALVDFDDVLRKKNAVVSMQQIIRELEAAQQPLWSPMVLNGSGMGVLANHSLVMASYIARANAAIIDLRELLAQG